jgi:hypothetical protein
VCAATVHAAVGQCGGVCAHGATRGRQHHPHTGVCSRAPPAPHTPAAHHPAALPPPPGCRVSRHAPSGMLGSSSSASPSCPRITSVLNSIRLSSSV